MIITMLIATAGQTLAGLCSELAFQLPVGLGKRLVNHLGITQHRHKVAVARPAGHDMSMDVAVNTGAGDAAYVDADVETLRLEDLFQHLNAAADELKMLFKLSISQPFQAGHLAVRGHHQVAGVIGVAV